MTQQWAENIEWRKRKMKMRLLEDLLDKFEIVEIECVKRVGFK
jgi:hypothetical protein